MTFSSTYRSLCREQRGQPIVDPGSRTAKLQAPSQHYTPEVAFIGSTCWRNLGERILIM